MRSSTFAPECRQHAYGRVLLLLSLCAQRVHHGKEGDSRVFDRGRWRRRGGSFFTLVWVLCARSALPHNKFVFQRVDDVVLTAEDLLMLNMCGWEIG